jgi:hypothetical protein
VSQISPPIRIVIVAAVALMGAWMLFLRPKPESAAPAPVKAPATAPGVKGLTSAVDKAKGASKTSDAANAKIQSATGEETGSATASKPAAKGAAGSAAAAKGSAKGLPARVQKAVDDKKVVVLFFYNPKSDDDRLVRRAVAKVDRWQGEVVVQSANVKSVARYAKIARGADVEQSPTIVVIDRNLKAEKLVGYQDKVSIDQAVVDALRNSGVLIKHRYLRSINQTCRDAGDAMFAIPQATQPGAELRTAVRTYENRAGRFVKRFKAVPAPARWRAFKRASVAELETDLAFVHKLARVTGDGTHVAPVLQFIATETPRIHKSEASFNARMDKHNVLSCGSNA